MKKVLRLLIMFTILSVSIVSAREYTIDEYYNEIVKDNTVEFNMVDPKYLGITNAGNHPENDVILFCKSYERC